MKMKSYILSIGSTTINGRDMVRDSAGVLHCVYSRYINTRYNVYHGWSTDGGKTWQEEAVTTDPRTGGHNNVEPAIDIDSDDNLHVVWKYCDISASVGRIIKYAKYNGSSWTITTPLIYTINYVARATVAVDSLDHIHVACAAGVDETNVGQIIYIAFDGSTWGAQVNLTTDTSMEQNFPTIAIGASNSIHIAWVGQYDGGGAYAIRYITCVGGSWGSVVNLDATLGFVATDSPCIALDSAGDVYVVYSLSDGTDKNIWLAKRTSGTWGFSQVSPDPTSGTVTYLTPTIAIDSADTVHLLFQDGSLYYMAYSGAWSALQHLTTDSSVNAHLRWSATNVPAKPQWTWEYGYLYFAEFLSVQSNAVWYMGI